MPPFYSAMYINYNTEGYLFSYIFSCFLDHHFYGCYSLTLIAVVVLELGWYLKVLNCHLWTHSDPTFQLTWLSTFPKQKSVQTQLWSEKTNVELLSVPLWMDCGDLKITFSRDIHFWIFGNCAVRYVIRNWETLYIWYELNIQTTHK